MLNYIKSETKKFKKDYPELIVLKYELDEWTYKSLGVKQIDSIPVERCPNLIKQKCLIIGNGINKMINLIGLKVGN